MSSVKTHPHIMVFDLGKVLIDFDWMIVVNRIAEKSGTSIDKFKALLTDPSLLLDYESGQLSSMEFYRKVQADFGYPDTFENFKLDFADMFTEISPMISLQSEIKKAGIDTYILSNTNEIAVDFICENYSFFENFEGYVYSFKEKCMKPDLKIYQAIEQLTNKSGNQIAFIDDNAANVEAAKSLGWLAQTHSDITTTYEFIKSFGWPVNWNNL